LVGVRTFWEFKIPNWDLPCQKFAADTLAVKRSG